MATSQRQATETALVNIARKIIIMTAMLTHRNGQLKMPLLACFYPQI